MELELGAWAVLVGGALVAGWIDAVIGGGGLVMIPLLMAAVPGLAPATALGTNKLVSISGTTSAAWTLVRRIRPRVRPAYVGLALVCSAAGALSAALIDATVLRPLIIVLLLVAGTFVAVRPQFGTEVGSGVAGRWRRWLVLLLVGVIAFYDGIFGPGTGMFLIMAFTALLSQNFLTSAAMAKVVNTSTNVGALIVFITGGHVWWQLALVLAVANVVGAQLGARTVLGGGTRLIRYALLTLVVVMCAYLGWQQYQGI